MRLVVDLQPVQGPSGERGIGYYATSLTRALAAGRGEHDVRVLLDGGGDPEAALRARRALSPYVAHDEVVVFAGPPLGRGRDERAAAAARESALAALQPDVVLLTSVFELADGATATSGACCPALPTAAVLYDLIPLGDLTAHKPDPVLRRTYLEGVRQLGRLDLLLAISQHSADEARRLLPECPPLRAVHGAAPEPPAPRRPLQAPDGGFGLAVGRHEPRKDVRTAVLAWAGVPAEIRQGRPFVVVGAWADDARAALQGQARAAGLPPAELRFVAAGDAELAWYYENADVLVFPSLQEGLGLPPLEAVRAGTPALLARTSSLVELNDDERVFFAAGAVDELAALVGRVLADETLRADLVARGRRAASRFTWERTAALAWEALLPLRRSSPAQRSLAVVGEAPSCAALPVDVPGAERVLHVGTADLAQRLVDRPGVVALEAAPEDALQLLAPAIGVVVPDVVTAAALVTAGVTSAPVVVATGVDEIANAAHAAYDGDPLEHWVRGDHDLPLEAAAPLLRRPRWAARPRGPVLGTDVSLYRSTAFLSGIQRTVLRLHAELAPLLARDGGGLVPLELGLPSSGTPHPAIAADPLVRAPVAPLEDVDWALCLDLDAGLVAHRADLQRARAAGLRVAVNIFDLLPWAHPEWWPHGAAEASFLPWLELVLAVGDVLLVNSLATARDLEEYVAQACPRRVDGFTVQLLRLGSDFPAGGLPDTAERDDDHLLVVGTVEPRKGHAELLDAVEQLWSERREVRLTVVGRAGWLVDDLVARMTALEAAQPGFSWLQGASDLELDRLYRQCTAAVVPSLAEGFGLPVVEAAVRDCPVVVRDAPVLRELAGPDATYFSDDRPLAHVLRRALDDPGSVTRVPAEALSTWGEVAQRLRDVLDGHNDPVASWDPHAGWRWT